VHAGPTGCSVTADGIAELHSHEPDSVVEQHCSAEHPDQGCLHWLLAYAEAGLDFVASVSSWQAIPVSSALHHLDSGDSVHHMRADVELHMSTSAARVAADKAVNKVVHRVGTVGTVGTVAD